MNVWGSVSHLQGCMGVMRISHVFIFLHKEICGNRLDISKVYSSIPSISNCHMWASMSDKNIIKTRNKSDTSPIRTSCVEGKTTQMFYWIQKKKTMMVFSQNYFITWIILSCAIFPPFFGPAKLTLQLLKVIKNFMLKFHRKNFPSGLDKKKTGNFVWENIPTFNYSLKIYKQHRWRFLKKAANFKL